MRLPLRLLFLCTSLAGACSASSEPFDASPIRARDEDDARGASNVSDGGDADGGIRSTTDASAPDTGAPVASTRIGLFVGAGAGLEYSGAVSKVLAGDARFVVTTFADGTVDFAKLDVVVMPGGTASTEWSALGTTGQTKLRSFVSGGGGYVGLCAGFYLALSYNAGFIDADNFEPWARGEGQIDVEIAPGNPVFTTPGKRRFRYVNGPVLQPSPKYTTLATFAGNIGSSTIVSMVGKPAVVASDYGKGRVVAFSPHPELSGLGSLLAEAIVWAAPR